MNCFHYINFFLKKIINNTTIIIINKKISDGSIESFISEDSSLISNSLFKNAWLSVTRYGIEKIFT